MADNIAPIFNGATGGRSDDKFTGIPNSFQDSSNIEIRQNPRGITLTKKLVKDSSTIITEVINCFLSVSNGNIMAFGQSGGVYRKVGSSWFKNSNTLGTAILSCIEYNGYVYFTTSTNLYRVAVGSLSNTMSFTSYQTLEASNYHPFLTNYNTLLYIGNKDKIATLSNVDVFISDFIKINPRGNIKFLNFISNNIKAYIEYKDFNKIEVAFYSLENDEIVDSYPLNGIIIDKYISKQGLDYVIIGNELGIINYPEEVKLKEIPTLSPNDSIVSNRNRIYIGGVGEIWEWGALNKNYPEVLSSSYTVSGGITSEIGALFVVSGDVYVSWKNGASYGVDKLSTTYNDSGYIISRVYYGQARLLQKQANLIQACFNKLTGTDKINIYTKYDLATDFTLVREITATSVKDKDFLDIFQITGDWNFIEIKIELISGNGTTTPEFYELFLTLNDIKQWQ